MTEILKHHILLIEDTASLATMYETSLTNIGYDVTSVQTGQAALNFVADNKTDLILLDLKLPDMDGLDLMDYLNDNHFNMPVIIITGHGSINVAVEAMRRGARDFLVKPFNVERLHSSVESEFQENSFREEMLQNPLESNPEPDRLAKVAGATLPSSNKKGGKKDALSSVHIYKKEELPKGFSGFIGTSTIMQKLYHHIESSARSSATVFVTGESGTGKEVCAEAIHKLSARRNRPFIPINCAAIPRDLMESELFGHVKGAFTGAISDRDGAAKMADGGTLFLDEIAEMNPDMQTKLLRFLQNSSFKRVGGNKIEKTDARIICATNRNPLEEIKAGRFREDLFYRLHVLPIYMPPLKDRGEDVIDIAGILLRRYTEEERKDFDGFTEDAENVLRRYSWPGNIRQLQNVIRNLVVMNNEGIVTDKMLSPELLHNSVAQFELLENTPDSTGNSVGFVQKDSSLFYGKKDEIRPLANVEREIIERAINICNGNIPKAAAHLSVSPSTIYRKKMVWDNQKNKAIGAESGLDNEAADS